MQFVEFDHANYMITIKHQIKLQNRAKEIKSDIQAGIL